MNFQIMITYTFSVSNKTFLVINLTLINIAPQKAKYPNDAENQKQNLKI